MPEPARDAVNPSARRQAPAARAAAAAGRQASVLREAAEMWRFAHRADIARDLKALHRPRPLRSVGAALADWALIGVAAAATSAYGWAAAPLALLVIGNRQRALGNLLHDASHWSMDRNRRRSIVLANLLFCWPLWVSMAIYRDEHSRHHRFLGDPARDPDYLHDAARLPRGWRALWWDQLRSPKMLRASVLAHLGRLDRPTLAGVTGLWGLLLGAITVLAGTGDALLFLGLWLAARATVFHLITSFREISDHVGLEPGGLIAFSRNHPIHGLASQLFHPHNNGYHLVHHLTPGIPFHAVPRAHRLLGRWPAYAAGEQCDAYFLGAGSAVRSWVRHAAAG